MRFRGGEFSTGTMGNFQPELTRDTSWTVPSMMLCSSSNESTGSGQQTLADGHGLIPAYRACHQVESLTR